jgi:isopenicillin N synthase-like dioxygenase
LATYRRFMATFSVPVVDISCYVSTGSDAQRDDVARAVNHASSTIGFFQVIGHGIPSSSIAAITAAMDSFFSLPMEAKVLFRAPPEVNRGYSPPRSESLSLSLGIRSPDDAYDLVESFNVGSPASACPTIALPAKHYPDNTWPSELPGFRPAVEAYFLEAGRVARTLTEVFADALGLSSGFFAPFTDHSIDVLRMNNYAGPVGSRVGLPKGMGEHTDYGIVTVLWADQVPGLQILGEDKNWHEVLPVDDALLINLGDLTARWTNDRWKSTLHRVVPPVESGRLRHRRSVAFFHDGNADAVIETLPTCLDATGSSFYGRTTVAQHLDAKLGGSRAGLANDDAEREAQRVWSAGWT